MKTIAKVIVGSRLYGTATPKSDTDYITVGLLTPREIVLGKSQNAQNKNGLDDKRLFDLKSFFEHLMKGQTWAIEALFAPATNLAQCTPLWNLLVRNRHLFLDKDIAAFVGFVRNQAKKYSDKGLRLRAVTCTLAILGGRDLSKTLDSCRDDLNKFVNSLLPEVKRYVGFRRDGDRTCDEFFSVCGRDFQMTQKLKVVMPTLVDMEAEFGTRTKEAEAANGKDWKALSHAVRVGIEANELLVTGAISFPLGPAGYILEVKEGRRPADEVDEIIENLLKNVELAKGVSRLPEKADREPILKLLSDILIQSVVDPDRFGQQWLYPVRGVIE